MPLSRSRSATASLAESMNSSMIWWLSVFSTTCAPVTRPFLSRSIFTSGMVSSKRTVSHASGAQGPGQFAHAS